MLASRSTNSTPRHLFQEIEVFKSPENYCATHGSTLNPAKRSGNADFQLRIRRGMSSGL